MKVIFVDESEITDLNDFVCEKCQGKMFNKNYLINKGSWKLILICTIGGIIIGLLI